MGFQYDVTDVEPSTGSFELLVPGEYRLEVSEISDETVTKDGTGKYVTMKFTVVAGEREGTNIFSNYNIKNKNPKAEEIAWREISALARAVGALAGDSDQMLYKPFSAKVGIEKSKDPQYKDKNKIEKFYPLDGSVPYTAAAPPTAPTAHAASTVSRAPTTEHAGPQAVGSALKY